MHRKQIKSDGLLLLTATIWGFAFVAQRMGMNHVGPFTFNGIRFALGALVLMPFIISTRKKYDLSGKEKKQTNSFNLALWGSAAGLAIFTGASFQQIGLVYTTAGKAGFITGLYVVIVPLMGLFWHQKTNAGTWIGAFLAAVGLYLLSVTEALTISYGDLLELAGALVWAGHIHLIGWASPKTDPKRLAFFQFVVCSLLSLVAAMLFETITASGLLKAAAPILYGGALSVGIAYTLQVMAQENAHPAHAAILLSLESVFAAIGGWFVLDELMSGRSLIGCALMLAGMLISQLYVFIVRGAVKAVSI